MVSSPRLISLFLLLALIWGSAFIGIDILVHHFPPWFGAAMRLAVAVLCLFILIQIRGRGLRLSKKLYFKIWGSGLVMVGLPFSFLFWGEQKISGGLAGVINGTTPLWMTFLILLAPSRKGSARLSFWVFLGVVLGFLGLMIIFYPRLSVPSGHDELMGALAVLVMAFLYAVGNLLNRKLMTENPGLRLDIVTFHQHLSSFVFLFLLSLCFETWPLVASHPTAWLAILYLGVFPSAFAFLIYFFLLKEMGAVRTGAVTYLVPFVALALDFIFQGHIPGLSVLIGMIFILIGLVFIQTSKPV